MRRLGMAAWSRVGPGSTRWSGGASSSRYTSSLTTHLDPLSVKPSWKRIPDRVRIFEVGPRDGLQNEAVNVSAEVKARLVDKLCATGLRLIECGSFVSPKAVPQMSTSAEVFKLIQREPGVCYSALTPTRKYLDAALLASPSEVAVFTAASESFNQKNIRQSIDQSLEAHAELIPAAKAAGLRVRGYVSCVLGCPFEGPVAPQKVLDVVRRLLDLGCYEVSLGDTIGVGTPGSTQALLEHLTTEIDASLLAVHFHDTFGQALANVLVALQFGVGTVDSSVAGLGGCPYAPGATGNLATEDLIYMLHGMGIQTGVDLERLLSASEYIVEELEKAGSAAETTQESPAAASSNKSKPAGKKTGKQETAGPMRPRQASRAASALLAKKPEERAKWIRASPGVHVDSV